MPALPVLLYYLYLFSMLLLRSILYNVVNMDVYDLYINY